MLVKRYLNRVRPPASPKMTGVCGGTWKYPLPFWTLFSCSPFTVGTRTQYFCKKLHDAVDTCCSLTAPGHQHAASSCNSMIKHASLKPAEGLVYYHLLVILVNGLLTMVHLVLFFVHGVDASPGPELQQSLQQQSAKVHCKDK